MMGYVPPSFEEFIDPAKMAERLRRTQQQHLYVLIAMVVGLAVFALLVSAML
jgi:hypothetical protein